MYRLLHSLTMGELFKRQLPVFALAFLIAELFYKFKSFALECAAFLITWYLLDAALQVIQRIASGSSERLPGDAER